ncbi:MAG: hypothetical protein ABI885_25015 [Gammaproteobacteria bacterium]
MAGTAPSIGYFGVVAAAAKLKAKQTLIDGEIVALDERGHLSFQALQNRRAHPQNQIVFYAFDALHLDGRDLTQQPLRQRRGTLPKLIYNTGLLLSQALPGKLVDIVAAVRAMGLEGVIAKRASSLYEPGERSADWQKLKLEHQQEFVIGGYRPSGSGIDALIVGYYEARTLRFAAKVRAGMIPHTRRELMTILKPLHTATCPFSDLPHVSSSRWGGGISAEEMKEMQWIKPKVVVQVRFVQWTDDNHLRHAAYLGLRPDKAAHDVVRELPVK